MKEIFVPGACKVEADGGCINIVHEESRLRVAVMVGTDVFTGEDFDMKYAHLFGASPDMHKALQAIIKDRDARGAMSEETWELVTTAMSKAEQWR